MQTGNVSRREHADAAILRAKLARLRTEFVDLAYSLERRGRIDAADVAIAASAWIGELCEKNAPTEKPAGASNGQMQTALSR